MIGTLMGMFDATQNRFRGDRHFRVWAANGAFRGALVSQSAAMFGLGDILTGLFVIDSILGLVLLIALLPIAILCGALGNGRIKERKQRLAKIDPGTEEYLEWDEQNFRLKSSEVENVELHEKAIWPYYSAPKTKMAVRLTNGETWHFTIATACAADSVQAALTDAGFRVLRRA